MTQGGKEVEGWWQGKLDVRDALDQSYSGANRGFLSNFSNLVAN